MNVTRATVVESHHETVTQIVPPAPTQVEVGLLCGMIRDEDGRPIAGARVMMADVGVAVVTDRNGRFCVTAPKGDRTLSILAMGFQTLRQMVSVGRQTDELSITLHSATLAPRDSAR